MSAGRYDLLIEQGATYTKVFTWYDENKDPIDLTTYTALMEIKGSVDSDTIIAASNSDPAAITITLGGALGTISISIAATITDAFDFDIAVWDILLTAAGVSTRVLEGEVKLSKAITRLGDEVYPVIESLIGTSEGDMIAWDNTLLAWKVLAGGASDSVARSMATSSATMASSQNTSQASLISVADSKAVSAATLATLAVANEAALSALTHKVGMAVWVVDPGAVYYCTSAS